MSRFLKFIVHLVVICAIICALALVLPPFFGVTTYVVDDASIKTNLPMGSVTYAIPKKTEDVYVNEPILVQEDSVTYRYEVQSLNLENGTGTVIDPTVTDAQPITVAVRDYVPKVVATIGFIGYLQVATKSMEGIIILALVVVFLVILYIIAELWKKGDDREDEDGQENEDSAESIDDADDEEPDVRPARPRKRKREEKRRVRTGGFVDEIDEEDDEDEPVSNQKQPDLQSQVREAHGMLRKEIEAVAMSENKERGKAAEKTPEAEKAVQDLPFPIPMEEEEKKPAPAEPAEVQPESLPIEKEEKRPAAAERRESSGKFKTSVEEILAEEAELQQKEENEKKVKRAIPGYSADELSEKAKADGDAPEVMKDDITDVTIFDYSDIL